MLIDSGSVLRQARETARRYPWYARLLDEAGGLPLPPLLTAGLLEKHYYAAPPDPALGLPLHSYSTSGTSTGKRKTIYYSEEDERWYVDIKAQMFLSWLIAGGVPIHRALADMGTGHAAGTALDVFYRMGVQGESVSFELPVERHLEKIDQFRPDLLYTMPSILDRIVRAAGRPERFGVRKIILVGEIAPPSWQKKIAERFGIAPADILDTYGSIEIGTIASYSHELGRYLVAEGLHAECVGTEALEEGFEPLPPGEGVLVLTSFVRGAFPAVRYVTYDVVRDFRTEIIGGVPRHSFEGIVKRIGPELKHGEKISLYDIEEAVRQFSDDAEIRVEIDGRKLAVRLRSPSLKSRQLPAIRRGIESRIPEIGAMIRGGLLDGIEVSLAPAGETEKEPKSIKTRKIHYGGAGSR
ncbi:AMP-binding protein [Cohnella sp. CFH 77786]|uniref:AMP-binding protein n=1 Tax=Cohnella sp. CFH 77786 TaxID=2662265 RepID=UPI001C60FE61|nr:AMP-binding protein [Cohnella sp. CFH 77786]MBW5447508.1 AMP-binding protein [Cohnella sp. CFH 77786]